MIDMGNSDNFVYCLIIYLCIVYKFTSYIYMFLLYLYRKDKHFVLAMVGKDFGCYMPVFVLFLLKTYFA